MFAVILLKTLKHRHMVKKIFTTCTSVIMLLAFKPASAQKSKSNNRSDAKTELRFINNIQIGMSDLADEPSSAIRGPKVASEPPSSPKSQFKNLFRENSSEIETASGLQLKYAVLMDTEVEQVQNVGLYREVDEWFGTRYVLGGTTKRGIDCSAFVQHMYTGLYGISLPRTAREQYRATRQISRTELEEGDLVFFNTRGGVSHVGIYLQNNKFVHAASSGGVMISDLYDNYWSTRFIGANRYERAEQSLSLLKP